MTTALMNNLVGSAFRVYAGAAGGDGIPVPTWVAVLVLIAAIAALTFAFSRWIRRTRK
jgi:hypothetical protein